MHEYAATHGRWFSGQYKRYINESMRFIVSWFRHCMRDGDIHQWCAQYTTIASPHVRRFLHDVSSQQFGELRHDDNMITWRIGGIGQITASPEDEHTTLLWGVVHGNVYRGAYVPDGADVTTRAFMIMDQQSASEDVLRHIIDTFCDEWLPAHRARASSVQQAAQEPMQLAQQVHPSRPALVEPRKHIPDKANDHRIVQYWHDGLTTSEIAIKINLSKKRVNNRICELRREHGAEIIPYRRKKAG